MASKRKNRRWTLEQKRRAVERMKRCGHDKLAEELDIGRRQLYAWRAQMKRLDAGLTGNSKGSRKDPEQDVRRLKEALATKVLEVEFFRGALRKIEARRQSSSATGETAFTDRCK